MAKIFNYVLHGAAGRAQCWVLPNVKGQGRERWISANDSERLERFAKKHDAPGFGVFFAVSTFQPERPRKKEFAVSLPFLFVDVDAKDHSVPIEEIERILRNLPCPPTLMVHSGHGIHCYWVLDAVVKLPDGMDRAEKLLRRLADHLGGDKSVAHVAALLRLPGTHNTKHGERHKVRLIKEGRERYSPDQMTRWLDAQTQPALVRRNAERATPNPFLRLAEEQGYAPPVDVFARLEAMKFKGEGDTSIHQTQLSVTASMAYHDVDEDDAVAEVFEATMALPEAAGWNATVEQRKIRGMYRDAVKKFKRGQA